MLKSLLPAVMTLGLAASATAQDRQPPIDAAVHYSGVWLEVGRTPMGLTKGCVAGTTRYEMNDATHVAVEDDCRQGGPNGKRRAIRGKGVIEDAPVNRRLKVTYAPFVTWRYEVLDRDPAGAWFIAANPKREKVFIYTRTRPSPSLLDELAGKTRALGYKGEIEFPAVG